jgi:hypothetical protein
MFVFFTFSVLKAIMSGWNIFIIFRTVCDNWSFNGDFEFYPGTSAPSWYQR